VNATGGDLAVAAGEQFAIYFPNFNSAAEVGQMTADPSKMPG